MFNKIYLKHFFKSEIAILIYLSFSKLLIHLFTNGNYGFHRDELYYIACGNHLAWGFVDHPPLVPLITVIVRFLFGDNLFSYRLLPALVGSLTVFLAGLTARQLGGKLFAQILAALAVIVAPIYLSMNGILTTNAFDQFFWVLALYILIILIKKNNPKYWLILGVICGIAILNKYTVLLLCLALFVTIFSTINKRLLLNRWLPFGVLIAIVIVLPNLVWQIKHGFPTIEFIKNAMEYKMTRVSPMDFILGEIFAQNPISLPIWLTGLYFSLISAKGKPFRIIAIAYLLMLIILIITQKSRTNYLAPVYPILFAAGAVLIEGTINKSKKIFWKPTIISVLIISGAICAPLSIPILPIDKLADYANYFKFSKTDQSAIKKTNLPPVFADMFGFQPMVKEVSNIYNKIAPEERPDCAIFTDSYGNAAAIDYFGGAYNLPKAIGCHNSYFLWGPRDYSGKLMITVGVPIGNLQTAFENVELVATVQDRYATWYQQDLPICVCRNLKVSLTRMWPNLKTYY